MSTCGASSASASEWTFGFATKVPPAAPVFTFGKRPTPKEHAHGVAMWNMLEFLVRQEEAFNELVRQATKGRTPRTPRALPKFRRELVQGFRQLAGSTRTLVARAYRDKYNELLARVDAL